MWVLFCLLPVTGYQCPHVPHGLSKSISHHPLQFLDLERTCSQNFMDAGQAYKWCSGQELGSLGSWRQWGLSCRDRRALMILLSVSLLPLLSRPWWMGQLLEKIRGHRFLWSPFVLHSVVQKFHLAHERCWHRVPWSQDVNKKNTVFPFWSLHSNEGDKHKPVKLNKNLISDGRRFCEWEYRELWETVKGRRPVSGIEKSRLCRWKSAIMTIITCGAVYSFVRTLTRLLEAF